ncbi:hypothetical protein R8510_00002 [Ralstonia chuxiongensis]|nr:hypothetical protein R8510_00002 [Ralstonia chuxiongensis]
MRTLLLIAGCLISEPSIAHVAWKCTYDGETYFVGMPCDEAIKRGITPPFKEWQDPTECAGLKQRRDAALAQLEAAVCAQDKVPEKEIDRLARDYVDLGVSRAGTDARMVLGCRRLPMPTLKMSMRQPAASIWPCPTNVNLQAGFAEAALVVCDQEDRQE